MASMRFDRLGSAACLLAAFMIALPVAAAPPSGAPPFHEWLFGRGRIGIRVQPLTPELREHFGAPKDRGVDARDRAALHRVPFRRANAESPSRDRDS